MASCSCSSSQLYRWLFVSIFLTAVPGVHGADGYNIGALVAAAAVAFLLLAVILAMIVMVITWNNWFPKLQWAKGKVKMPKAYWKKKEEAKLRLLHGSRSALASQATPSEAGLPNGNVSRVHDTEEKSDEASWVQGWNNANHLGDGGYEEMALAMDLGEEDDVHIVTTHLDHTHTPGQGRGSSQVSSTVNGGGAAATATLTQAQGQGQRSVGNPQGTAAGDIVIYSSVDRSKKSSETGVPPGAHTPGTNHSAAGSSMQRDGEEGPAATSEKVTSFSKMDPYLVAL